MPSSDLENKTPFGVRQFNSVHKTGEALLVVCAAAHFELPEPGRGLQPLCLSDEQTPPSLQDEYWGDPAESSLRYEGQSAYTRPKTDVYVAGHAWTARGRPAIATEVLIRVGHVTKTLVAIGDRFWKRTIASGLVPTDPVPFSSMPLRYEYAFGGTLSLPEQGVVRRFEQNPVGKGLYVGPKHAKDQPLPNLENRNALIKKWSDAPAPAGVGPVARGWSPRLQFAGTYDQHWKDERAPLWPDDFDERFFQAASNGLVIDEPVGGEEVELRALSPDGVYRFSLERIGLEAQVDLGSKSFCSRMKTDALYIDTDARTLTQIFRATFTVGDRYPVHQGTVVRAAEEGR